MDGSLELLRRALLGDGAAVDDSTGSKRLLSSAFLFLHLSCSPAGSAFGPPLEHGKLVISKS